MYGCTYLKNVFIVFKASVERTYYVDCYFPMQQNNMVTLYQDAHCSDHMAQFTQMMRPDDQPHVPRSCWKDLYFALMEAEEIICITGWAVWTGR